MNIKSNLLLAITIVLSFTAAQELRASEQKQAFSKQECEVWSREKSFAASVENHDAKAFAEHIDENAVFINNSGSYTRGSVEVAKAWAGIIEGKEIILRWNPDFVGISSDGKSAVSRGRYWMFNPDPAAKKSYMTGTFQSTWVKNKKGQWHVFLDGGTPGPVSATMQEVQTLKSTFRNSCTE